MDEVTVKLILSTVTEVNSERDTFPLSSISVLSDGHFRRDHSESTRRLYVVKVTVKKVGK